MKSISIALISGLLLTACLKNDTKTIVPDDPDWIRLEAPTGGEALDVAGNIDSTLFVATTFKVYKTANQGKTWEMIRERTIGPHGVFVRKDTLWVLMGRGGTNKDRYVFGTLADYTVDGGKTWQKYGNRNELRKQINSVKAPDGTTYAVKDNVTPFSPASSDGYVNPSDIVKQAGGSSGLLRFPFKHTISSLQLDAKNRLYVSVSGTHIPETNRIYCCPRELPSVVYVSKRPLP